MAKTLLIEYGIHSRAKSFDMGTLHFIRRLNLPLKRKKEREGESLILLDIGDSIKGSLLGLIGLEKYIAL